MEAPLAYPLLRNLREFLSREGDGLCLLGYSGNNQVDYLEEGRTVNGAYYAEELRWLCQEIVRRKGKLTGCVLLLQDNAPAHTWQFAMVAATECGFEVLSNPLYTPDLAPSDICLFPNLKTNLRGRNFGSNEGVIHVVAVLGGPG